MSTSFAMRGSVSTTEETKGRTLSAESLYLQHAGFVARFLSRLGADASELDDLVNEVFIVVVKRGGFTPKGAKATTWLGEIAFRVAANERRKLSRRGAVVADAVDQAAVNTSPEIAAIARDSLARVDAALETLKLEHRAILVLFEIEGEGCDEIAQAMSIPVGTVYSRLHAARAQFIKAYKRTALGPGKRPK